MTCSNNFSKQGALVFGGILTEKADLTPCIRHLIILKSQQDALGNDSHLFLYSYLLITGAFYSFFKTPSKISNSSKIIWLKYHWIYSTHWILKGPIIPENAIFIDLPLCSNTTFSLTTSLISSNRVAIKNFHLSKSTRFKICHYSYLPGKFNSPKQLENFDIETRWFLNSFFSKTTDLIFFKKYQSWAF